MALTIRTTLACAAALAATVTTGAAAAQAQAADTTAFTRVATVTDSLATHIAAQADAQHKAAEAAKQKAAAEAKAKQEREAQAAKAKAKAQAAAAAKQRAARASRSAGVRKSLTGWMKPVNSSISTPYHATSSLWASGYHTGADFIASTGTPVHAVGPATVVEAGWGGSYGNNVILRMSDGMYVLYGHLSSIGVSVGQTVSAGQQLGLSGATGNVTGPHLHFEVRTTQSYGSDVDPVAYLRKHGVTV
jgi:murein DD-endopeptidase MepM/ murein hydrolase activator NlpD